MKIAVLILILLSLKGVFAQVECIENETTSNEDISELEDYVNMFYEFEISPLLINIASKEELEKSGLFTPFQVLALMDYRENYGMLYSIYELKLILGFTDDIIYTIKDYISVDVPEKKYKLFAFEARGKNECIITYSNIFEKLKGESDSAYLGSANGICIKTKAYVNDRLKYGFLAEKDRGERLTINDSIFGFDFYSAYISYSGKKFQLNVGDFHACFGLGLTLNTGFSLGKYISNNYSNSSIFRPYSSRNEDNFFRGLALSGKLFKRYTLSGFISNKKIDAGLSANNKIETLYVSGDHSTKTYFDKKNTVGHTCLGFDFEYRNRWLKSNLHYVSHFFDKEFSVKEGLYGKYAMNGSVVSDIGLNAVIQKKKFQAISEIAIDKDFDIAFLAGMSYFLSEEFQAYITYRNYDKAYNSYQSKAFSEGGVVQNEEGLFLGFSFLPTSSLQCTFYYDFFYFPWLRYTSAAPSAGNEYMLSVNVNIGNASLYARYKYEKKEIYKASKDVAVKQNYSQIKDHLDISTKLFLTEKIKAKCGISFSRYSLKKKESGFLFYSDVICKLFKRTNITFRYARFETEYNSRIYAYEYDVYQNFTISPYYYTGNKILCIISTKVKDFLKIQCRISRIVYDDKDMVGTGLNEIDGNTKTEMKLLLGLRI